MNNNFPFSWDFGFRKNLRDEEAGEQAGFLKALKGLGLYISREDVRKSLLGKSGTFSVSSYFKYFGSNIAKTPPDVQIWHGWWQSNMEGWLLTIKSKGGDLLCGCPSSGASCARLIMKMCEEGNVTSVVPASCCALWKEKNIIFLGKGRKMTVASGCSMMYKTNSK